MHPTEPALPPQARPRTPPPRVGGPAVTAVRRTGRALAGTFGVLGRHHPLAAYPLATALVVLALTFVFVVPLFEAALGAGRPAAPRFALLGAVYAAYALLDVLTAISSVALVSHLAARLDGTAVHPAAGLARAARRLGPIAVHSFVSATLGLAAFAARVLVNPLFGMVIAPAVGQRLWDRWRHLSYRVPLLMAVPVIALEVPRPRNVFARGDALVRRTWGEHATPANGVGLLAPLALLPFTALLATPLLRRGLAEGDAGLVRLGLAATLLATSAYLQLNALVNAVLALAAYRYATRGKRDVFPGQPGYAEDAFVRPARRGTALTDR